MCPSARAPGQCERARNWRSQSNDRGAAGQMVVEVLFADDPGLPPKQHRRPCARRRERQANASERETGDPKAMIVAPLDRWLSRFSLPMIQGCLPNNTVVHAPVGAS